MLEHFRDIPAISTLPGITVSQGIECVLRIELLVESFIEDRLDGSIAGVVEIQCALASGIKTMRPIGFLKSDNPLYGSEVMQDTITK